MDELRNIQVDTEIIPEGCLNFVEESKYIVSAVDEEFDAIMEACKGCGSDVEIAPADGEEGSVPTDESAEAVNEGFKEIKEKIVEALQNVWSTIKKMFDDALRWINDQINAAKEKAIDKSIDAISKKDIPVDKVLGKVYSGEGLDNVAWMKALERKFGAVEEIPAIALRAVSGTAGANVDIAAMKKGMKEAFLGKEIEINGANFDAAELKSALMASKSKKAIKAAYNESRKIVNNLIKEAKAEKKDKNSTEADKNAAAIHINVLKREAQVLATGVGVQLDALRTYQRSWFALGVKVAAKGKKKAEAQKEEPKQESVEIFAW